VREETDFCLMSYDTQEG